MSEAKFTPGRAINDRFGWAVVLEDGALAEELEQ